MTFNSLEFFIFFLIVTILYFNLPQKVRWMYLLVSSCVFYMAYIPTYILILFAIIIFDYFIGLLIGRLIGKIKKITLFIGISINISVLFLFKYYDFVNVNIFYLIGLLTDKIYETKSLGLLLPIGLSFHTFQSISYLVEVYRGKQFPEKHLGIFALYILFFSQIVAGPIERPQNMLWQFKTKHTVDYNRIADGLKLIVWGLFKKVVVADRLAVWVNEVFAWPYNFTGLPLIIATICFSYQIYCDFSGYTDIAVGTAQILGFRLTENFRQPYWSKSISEFWNRWHISLSTWFRDYLFLPLRTKRSSQGQLLVNLMIVFFISGIWHGANWGFIVWGILHGLCRVADIVTRNYRMKIYGTLNLDKFPTAFSIVRIIVTFGFVSFAWIFFRATSLSDAIWIVTHIFPGIRTWLMTGSTDVFFTSSYYAFPGSTYEHLISIGSILILELGHYLQRNGGGRKLIRSWPIYVRFSLYVVILFIIISFVWLEDSPQFIYFQF